MNQHVLREPLVYRLVTVSSVRSAPARRGCQPPPAHADLRVVGDGVAKDVSDLFGGGPRRALSTLQRTPQLVP